MAINRDLRRSIELAVGKIGDRKSFLDGLLSDVLEWPVADAKRIEDISYSWSEEDLRASGLKDKLAGSVLQIQPAATNQPWGIFVLEFKKADALRRGMAGVLRQVLRGLVATRRRDPQLPSWKREHLLFICTHEYKEFRFAYFRSKHGDAGAARLATFGWGPNSSNRTLSEFNLPALFWPDDPDDAEAWVSAWTAAFDKEPLTRDFFKRFDKALEAIQSDLEVNQGFESAEAYTHSQLLLERLIFLYFLQNRGWLNRNHQYLKEELGKHTEDGEFTYYFKFLDKLFWTLSSAPDASNRFDGVPFLNGGLFDDDEFLQVPNRKVSPPLKVTNGTMRMVFDELLEAFNFTVTEDTPLNQEVAVDPEMLGKVFESIVLHAEQADEDANAPDKRKGTGSYYTPRIVVHFICRETLYQYLLNHLEGDGWAARLKAVLETDVTDGFNEAMFKKLRSIVSPEQAAKIKDLVLPLKCCDPAVGSGAFPVGLMQELVNLRRVLETIASGKDPVVSVGHAWLHTAKAHVVENCLFGVDIQQQAIEICRLRLWLSLVVDYDLGVDPFNCEWKSYKSAIDRISQLPNLEMNFRRGDSLHDRICGVPVVILPGRTVRHFEDFKSISKLGAELHEAKRSEKKKRLRIAILKKRLELSQKLVQEEIGKVESDDSALDGLFGIEDSKSKKRERNERELVNLRGALTSIQNDAKDLEKLERTQADAQFYSKLRKLEGADFNSPFNFAWHIDYPNVFAIEDGGFDIVVGNPPFVTARNREKRELWAERWRRVCYKNYQLVAPFFDLSFGLLKTNGQLGFIVSNAFAKRDFGEPLIDNLFARLRLQKVIDCSGLMFPGHGTPTFIVAGMNAHPKDEVETVVTITKPGGGDLKTPPEESPLWSTISVNNGTPGFADNRISVAAHTSKEMGSWPWRFVASASSKDLPTAPLSDLTSEPVGAQFITGKDDAFLVSEDYVRRRGLPMEFIRRYATGENIRDWQIRSSDFIIFPYKSPSLEPCDEPIPAQLDNHLGKLKSLLENSIISGSIRKKETKLKWFEYRRLARAKFKAEKNIVIPQIATHPHFVLCHHETIFKEKAPAIALLPTVAASEAAAITGILNSSFVTEYLKSECFSKRESEEAARDTYFEFSGNKLETIPVPSRSDENANTFAVLGRLSEECLELGKKVSADSARACFASFDSPYSLPAGEIAAGQGIAELWHSAIKRRIGNLERMIALQEEIDWASYTAYGQFSNTDPAGTIDESQYFLQEELRIFRLWEKAKNDFASAVQLVPSEWPQARRELWKARLVAMRDNEQIRRIEQPAYKRRWDEQWKVGNQWRCGEIAYAAEFIDAFEWWLKEKAEWWLQYKKVDGPASSAEWSVALWNDQRVQAAWPLAAEKYAYVESEKARERADEGGDPAPASKKPDLGLQAFQKLFKRLIEEESVPIGYDFGTPYEELEKKLKRKIPVDLKNVRGRLNVPRERFHRVDKDTYKWAGLQFQVVHKSKGTSAASPKK